MNWNAPKAFIFDFDGVLMDSSALHARAWKKAFDPLLLARKKVPFSQDDYAESLDGVPRLEGIERFLARRQLELPQGAPEDAPGIDTRWALARAKQEAFSRLLEVEGVEVRHDTVSWISQLKERGRRTALISSSRNARALAERQGLLRLFDTAILGDELKARGKPAPDIFLQAAERLGALPEECVVVEDSPVGVRAARAGGVGFIVALAQREWEKALSESGADAVVPSLDFCPLPKAAATTSSVPSALTAQREWQRLLGNRKVALFLDYDGTLTPIVPFPKDAWMSEEMRERLRRLCRLCTVSVVSGRELSDVQARVQLKEVTYAANHGFDIEGPGLRLEMAKDSVPFLDEAEGLLSREVGQVEGVWVERKKYSLAVHHRRLEEALRPAFLSKIEALSARFPSLVLTKGKCVQEFQPRVVWNKGLAVEWLLQQVGLSLFDCLPIYVGDDLTDETAFEALGGKGLCLVVREGERPTAAQMGLDTVEDVGAFLSLLETVLQERPP
jgi:alpha,alpha-trehalase